MMIELVLSARGRERKQELERTSHHGWTLLEGRGFSPAEIAAPTLNSSRTPRSLRLQAARGAGLGNNQDGFATAGLNRLRKNSKALSF
jgi:hypothetical protein